MSARVLGIIIVYQNYLKLLPVYLKLFRVTSNIDKNINLLADVKDKIKASGSLQM